MIYRNKKCRKKTVSFFPLSIWPPSNMNWNTIFFLFLFFINTTIYSHLAITEIHYHPLNNDTISGNEYEFLELKNIGDAPYDFTNIAFTNGIEYAFPSGTQVNANEFIVIAANATEFTKRYGFQPFGTYTGKLSNKGERVTLTNTILNQTILSVRFYDIGPWPIAADGTGYSLVSKEVNPSGDPNDPSYWVASNQIHGSPNSDDTGDKRKPVYINEVVTHTDSPATDAIELYNPNAESIDLSGWFLTDNMRKPKKFKIPKTTLIAANSYHVFYEKDFNANPEDTLCFSLSSHGEEVYIFSADSNMNLTGFCHGFQFGEIENDQSFGRYVTSTGAEHFVQQKESTLGKKNMGPKVGPVIFSELMYHPINNHEFVEIKNISNEIVQLFDPNFPGNTWKVNGIGFQFPQNITLGAGGIICLVSDTIPLDSFRSYYSIGEEVQLFHYSGVLSNGGECLSLLQPAPPYVDPNNGSTVIVPYILIDRIDYNDKAPWPIEPDGNGPSLERKILRMYGNDPTNWIANPGSPGSVDIINKNLQKQDKQISFFLRYTRNSPHLALQFTVPTKGYITMTIHNPLGKTIHTIFNGIKQAGTHSLEFDKSFLSAGIYFVHFNCIPGYSLSKKLILIE